VAAAAAAAEEDWAADTADEVWHLLKAFMFCVCTLSKLWSDRHRSDRELPAAAGAGVLLLL
jgi:hypothetical protein